MLAAATLYRRGCQLTAAVSPRYAATMAAAPLRSPPAVPPARHIPLSPFRPSLAQPPVRQRAEHCVFSIVLMRLGVRTLLDGQPEEAFQLGPKGRESEVYLARFCLSGVTLVSDCPKASVAAAASCSMAGCSGLCVSETRNSSAGSIAKPPSSVVFAASLPARMAHQMSTLLVPVCSAASRRLRKAIATRPMRFAREGSRAAVNEGLRVRIAGAGDWAAS